MKRIFLGLLLGCITGLLQVPVVAASLRVWSDIPAFTQVQEYQDEGALTSDVFDGQWEGDERVVLPRVKTPSALVKWWQEGEGINTLNEETFALSRGKYPNPIRIWEAEPYPIGNGRLAASVFHGSGRDRYTLNETSFWSGGSNRGTINAHGDKRYNEGHGPEIGDDGFGGYQPVVDLVVDFQAPVKRGSFSRAIDLERGCVVSEGIREGVKVRSQAFCSFPDQVMVIHYGTDAEEGFSANILCVKQRPKDKVEVDKEGIVFRRTLANGIECEAQIAVLPEGGSLEQAGSVLSLHGVRACTFIVAIETNYVMDASKHFRGEAAHRRINQRFAALKGRTIESLIQRHETDYQSLFKRLTLSLAKTSTTFDAWPTYQRLAAYRQAEKIVDVGLEETLFNFGRYLLICTSRPGGLPAGLQGIWNGMVEAPWGNDYHSNINFQMVYWLAETGNLSECHLAMLDYLCAMQEPFQENTRDYLKAIGEDPETPDGEWIVYTSHNPFGGGGWQVNLPGAAWYGLHFWEHYAFTQDITYLRQQAYPILKALCMYWIKHLKPLGAGGKGFHSNYQPVDVTLYPSLSNVPEGTLVVPHGWSPEHGPRGEDGVAHDQQIISELFLNTVQAAKVLEEDSVWIQHLNELQQRLWSPQIGQKGNLMEWMIDRNPETDHRHTSHLFAVFPGRGISVEGTPDFAQAARRSLELRKTTGDGRRSWAWAWRSLLWARLQDGNRAHAMLQGLIKHNMLDNLFTTHHLPLQIDGNYGIAAAMLEMLVQSHAGVIELLPALPAAWPEGSVKGVKARGNITIDMTWKDGRVTSWKLNSPKSQRVRVKVHGKYHFVDITGVNSCPPFDFK